MSYLYERFNRRRADAAPAPSTHEEIPTVDDYNDLLQAYRHLHDRYEQQSAELKARQSDLAIRDEALHRQGVDLKQMEAELLFVKAALQRAEEKSSEAPNGEAQWRQRYEQLQGEVESMRKRWEQRLANDTGETRARILLDMLPFADNLDLAIQYVQSLGGQQAVAFVGNIETIRRAFVETLRRYSVERIEAQGQHFDPHRHEAIGKIKDASVPVDHIVQVIQAGYMDGERVLRPARVIISAGQ
jgi:molecular chaperone GrpE